MELKQFKLRALTALGYIQEVALCWRESLLRQRVILGQLVVVHTIKPEHSDERCTTDY